MCWTGSYEQLSVPGIRPYLFLVITSALQVAKVLNRSQARQTSEQSYSSTRTNSDDEPSASPSGPSEEMRSNYLNPTRLGGPNSAQNNWRPGQQTSDLLSLFQAQRSVLHSCLPRLT